jgi:hypothetical protein
LSYCRRRGRGEIFNNQSRQGFFEIPYTNPMGRKSQLNLIAATIHNNTTRIDCTRLFGCCGLEHIRCQPSWPIVATMTTTTRGKLMVQMHGLAPLT